jgi:hypothetical protein
MTAVLYRSVIDITESYLGPAAQRFISRQVNFHLGKKPEELNPSDLPQLIEWLKTALALLTEDKQMIDEFEQRMNRLGDSHQGPPHS